MSWVRRFDSENRVQPGAFGGRGIIRVGRGVVVGRISELARRFTVSRARAFTMPAITKFVIPVLVVAWDDLLS